MERKPFIRCSNLALGAGAALVTVFTTSPCYGDEAEAGPATQALTGVVRDFIERTKPNGHPDFERQPSKGFGLYVGNIATTLGPEERPVFTGAGRLVNTQWKDSANRPICYTVFNPDLGDVAGTLGAASTGAIQSAATFNQWYTDVPGMNMSQQLTITLVRQEDGSYVFDDKTDPLYSSKGGFFPIDGQLLGNSGGSPDHNFHFTFELDATFTYHEGQGQCFRYVGDDDVWVYINNQLVIDLGGVHSAKEQYVELDRLNLTDGESYPLHFFFAERHRTQSNFRIQTNLDLTTGALPSVTAAFD